MAAVGDAVLESPYNFILADGTAGHFTGLKVDEREGGYALALLVAVEAGVEKIHAGEQGLGIPLRDMTQAGDALVPRLGRHDCDGLLEAGGDGSVDLLGGAGGGIFGRLGHGVRDRRDQRNVAELLRQVEQEV